MGYVARLCYHIARGRREGASGRGEGRCGRLRRLAGSWLCLCLATIVSGRCRGRQGRPAGGSFCAGRVSATALALTPPPMVRSRSHRDNRGGWLAGARVSQTRTLAFWHGHGRRWKRWTRFRRRGYAAKQPRGSQTRPQRRRHGRRWRSLTQLQRQGHVAERPRESRARSQRRWHERMRGSQTQPH